MAFQGEGRVEHFAVSANGTTFAALIDESKPDEKGIVLKKLVVVSLDSLQEKPPKTTEWKFVRATCGTI